MISFTLTPADLTEMHRHMLRTHQPTQLAYAWRTIAIFVLAVAIAAFLEYKLNGFIPRIFYVAASLAILPGIAMIASFFYLNVPNLSYITTVRTHGKDALTQTLSLEDEGIRQKRSATDTLWRFEGFREAAETANLTIDEGSSEGKVLTVPVASLQWYCACNAR